MVYNPIREIYFYEEKFDGCAAWTARNVHNRFQNEKIPDGIAKRIVVSQVSEREAECIAACLGKLGEYRCSVREAHNPEHRHLFFRDCDNLLVIDKAA